MNQNKLLFIGSTVADVVIRVPNLPRTGDDVHIASQQIALGGCAFNAFSAAQLSGAGCTLFSPVGSGMWGDWVYTALQGRGITSPIPRVNAPNGCCYCLVDESGERSFLCEHGAEYRFQPDWFDLLADAHYSGVYVCGIEIEEPTGDAILAYLENCTADTIYFAPGPRLCHIPPERMARLLALHPVLHLSESEALQFTCTDDVAFAARRINSVTQNDVVITMGADGAYVLADGAGSVVPAVRAQVTDTIGAGDAHIGALMACCAAGMTLPEAVAAANSMSAAVVSIAGATLTAEQWQAWLAANQE